ncbi:hypothetical protein BDZ89DRAFT_1041906 [Hymenopellis radicata]|nr:hypothetical protein BDZ89DRAFT_1041906 [Hymenopellis radicata]
MAKTSLFTREPDCSPTRHHDSPTFTFKMNNYANREAWLDSFQRFTMQRTGLAGLHRCLASTDATDYSRQLSRHHHRFIPDCHPRVKLPWTGHVRECAPLGNVARPVDSTGLLDKTGGVGGLLRLVLTRPSFDKGYVQHWPATRDLDRPYINRVIA